jgi:hypothetical protein
MTQNLLAPGLEAESTPAYTNWDADVTYGCNCDFGYSGPDCSLSTCATVCPVQLCARASLRDGASYTAVCLDLQCCAVMVTARARRINTRMH